MSLTASIATVAWLYLGVRFGHLVGARRRPRGSELQNRIEQLERELGIGQ